MTPSHTSVETPIGELMLVVEDGALSGLYFPGHWHPPAPAAIGPMRTSGFEVVERELAEYFAGDRTSFEVGVKLAGDEFQRRVWDRIAAIPHGETTTYGEIARELGGETDARGVGAAVGRNPVSIVVPCHRVLGSDGSLTGYAGGLERKRFLLDLESPSAQLTLDQ
jgi:methylated-DNA-[protein]-cysteine S-methyltransferase